MYSKFDIAKKYLHYWLTASNGKGHGVHSPFVFDFITNVLKDTQKHDCFALIESVRKQNLKDKRLIEVQDFGAGSTIVKTNQRQICQIAASSLKPKKYAQLLFRMARYYQARSIVELGTSLGITTSYLASSNFYANVFSFEGSPAIADIAADNMKDLGLKNVHLLVGEFGEKLPVFLSSYPKTDLVFIDGNHRKQPTLQYFEQFLATAHDHTILIFDDIHWSAEMESAWKEIQQHPKVTMTIDLFFIGIVFIRTEFKVTQHFTIRY